MSFLRFLTKSGLRVSLLVAGLVFLYHLSSELRMLAGGAESLFQRLELTAQNLKIRARGSEPPPEWRVAVAVADEKAVQALGRFPWSREVFARLNHVLTEAGARSIAYDMTFSDATSSEAADVAALLLSAPPTKRLLERAKADASLAPSAEEMVRFLETRASGPSPDEVFAQSVKDSGRVVLGLLANSEVEADVIGAAAVQENLRGVVSSTLAEVLVPDETGAFRVERRPIEIFDEGLYARFFGISAPVPVIGASAQHLGTINAFPDRDGVYRRVPLISVVKGEGIAIPTLALKAVAVAEGVPIELVGDRDGPIGVRLGERFIETELGGTVALHWYGEFSPREMPIVSIADLLSENPRLDMVKDRVVLVAATAVGTYDQRVTPFGDSVPGVHVHTTLAQNLLDGRHLHRPQYVLALELALFLLIGLAFGLLFSKLGVFGQVAGAVALAVAWLAIDREVFFARGLVVYTVLPTVQIFLTLLATISWRFLVEEAERRKTKRAFSQYLSPAVMEQVLADPEEYLRLGGRRYEATVLFSDIRGFTTFSEALTPEALGTLLNRYMTPMTDIVFGHGGTLDKYIGDAVMAFWGAPLLQPDHALRACRAALEMQAKVRELNVGFEKDGLPRVQIGIGLSSGPMTIGNMGSDEHFAYTALGDRVNLGSRLEGQTKDFGVEIMVSEATWALVRDQAALRELGGLKVKGKNEPVRVFELIAVGPMPETHRAFVEAFEEGLRAFSTRRFEEAVVAFRRAQAVAPSGADRCTDEYLALSEAYVSSPPPADWDGVRVATSK